MSAPTVNVFRYSALVAGVFYGLYHQATLTSAQKLAAIDREYAHKQSLIEKAKAEYTKKNMPVGKMTAGGDVIRDPNDSRFDLEAYLNVIAAEEA